MSKICTWFQGNYFKNNPISFHFFLNPFGESKLKKRIINICSKPNQKIHALTMVSVFMCLQKRRNFIFFIASQFNYCPVV